MLLRTLRRKQPSLAPLVPSFPLTATGEGEASTPEYDSVRAASRIGPARPPLLWVALLALGIAYVAVRGFFSLGSAGGGVPVLVEGPIRLADTSPPIERLTESATISFGGTPLNVVVTLDGTRLCVACSIPAIDAPGGLSVLSSFTRRVVGSMTLPEAGIPADVAVSPDGTRCFISITKQSGGTITPGRNRIDVVDITTTPPRFERSIVVPSPTNFGPIGIAVNAAGTRLYAADRGAGAVHVIDIDVASQTRFQVLTTVASAGDSVSVAVTPDGSRVYVANRSRGSVACIDATTHTIGGTSCRGTREIRTSVGISGSTASVVIAPDGKKAYAVFATGTPCISVIDTDPASGTFNTEIATIPTTGTTLDALSINTAGTKLAVLGVAKEELLIIDTVSRKQEQRIAVGRGPVDSAFDSTGALVAYVSNATAGTVSVIASTEGAMLRPDQGDRRTGDVMFDAENVADCQPAPRDGLPNLAMDSRVSLSREGNIIRGFDPRRPSELVECVLSNPHPITGRYQTCTLRPPQQVAKSSGGLWNWAKKMLQATIPSKHTLTIDSYDGQFRPTGFLLESEVGGTVIESRATTAGPAGEGVRTGFDVNAVSFFPAVRVSTDTFDLNGDGARDYAAVPYQARGRRVFLPLGDTTGDGIPDAPAFDFDHDGRPDPDLPLLPLFAGPATPPADLRLHFAQFGNGTSGGVSLSSQLLLFNLDTARAANVRVALREDQGGLLTVNLNGDTVRGETSLVIPAGGLRILQTDGLGPVVVGSATVFSDRAVAGLILFGGSGGLAGVGPSHVMPGGFVANVETNGAAAINTGVAVMNLEPERATLQLVLSDVDGKALASGQLSLAGQGHRAFFVTEVNWQAIGGATLDLSRFNGLLKVGTTGRVAATVIQARPSDLATMPVAPRFGTLLPVTAKGESQPARAAVDGSALDQNLYFAQFGNGRLGGYQISSQILLFNVTDQPAVARVALKDDRGGALTVNLNGERVNGEIVAEIPAGGLRIFQSDGNGELQAGSVTVSSSRLLEGVILFAGSGGAAGVGTSPLVRRGFEAPVQTQLAAGVDTGIAVMNLENREVALQLRLTSLEGTLLANAEIRLPALGHAALFVDQIRWQPVGSGSLNFAAFSGLLKASAAGKTAATVLQTGPTVLATQPVVPSLN